MRQKLWSITQTLRLPSICVLCNQYHKNATAVCASCIAFIKPIGPCCQYCACPLPDADYPICGQCIKTPPHFDKALIAYTFEEPLRGLLHQFKYHNGLYLRSFLIQLMLHSWKETTVMPQCLIPVPMHPQRLRKRGFNQAAILAKSLSRALNIPYDVHRCKKRLNTAPQASLDGEQRQKNLRHAFTVEPLPYEHVMLVDDLLTTGSTANELAHTLKKSGVKRVDIWCCARTIVKQEI